jgi:hypothetical protein
VAVGWGQPLLDFIFKMHMLQSSLQVQPFKLGYALTLIGITFFVGVAMGIFMGAVAKALGFGSRESL